MTVFIFLAVPLAYTTNAWLRWRNERPRYPTPIWRTVFGILALAASSGTTLLCLGTAVFDIFVRRFEYYEPSLLLIFRIGLLAGLAGAFLAVFAKGKLRVSALVSSLLMFALWVLIASLQ